MTDTEPKKIKLNVADFTLGDLEILEEETGMQLQDIDLNRPPARVLSVMLYLAGRHDDPEYTLDQARAIKLAQLDVVLVDEDDQPNPTAAGSGSSPDAGA